MQLNMTTRGLNKLYRDLGAYTKRERKALNTAIKVEGFRRLRQLREDIKAGHPGGKPYAAELSKIAGRTKTGRLRKNQAPLYRLARLLRYRVEYRNGDLQFAFGFLSRGRGGLGGRYKGLIKKHQEGIDVLYSGSRRDLGRRLARIGGKLKKKGDPDAKYFFLRKSTRRRGSIPLPARPMVEPYEKSHQADIIRSIRRNFLLKLGGQRI
jgi:hypothetical protein